MKSFYEMLVILENSQKPLNLLTNKEDVFGEIKR